MGVNNTDLGYQTGWRKLSLLLQFVGQQQNRDRSTREQVGSERGVCARGQSSHGSAFLHYTKRRT